MILTFSEDKFVDRIKSGVKVHTIREDKTDRWKVGRTIQFWRGNPRNVKNKPYQFGTGVCSEVHRIRIYPALDIVNVFEDENYFTMDLQKLATKDGFDSWEKMKEWFKEPFIGKIIYWEEFKTVDNLNS